VTSVIGQCKKEHLEQENRRFESVGTFTRRGLGELEGFERGFSRGEIPIISDGMRRSPATLKTGAGHSSITKVWSLLFLIEGLDI